MQATQKLPSIVRFEKTHIPSGVILSQAESWPHRPEDWALIQNISDGLVALDNDEVVGTAFCTPFGDKLATLNMIIVADSQRGRGLGTRFMDRLIELAGARTIRLIATEAGYPLYLKMGFEETGRILQQQGVVQAFEAGTNAAIESAGTDDHEAILALDAAKSGLDRHALWQELFQVSTLKVIRDQGAIVAVAACRDFGRGKVVGPVLADDAATARQLIAAHLAENIDTFVRIDVPAESGLGAWLESFGLTHAGGGRIMMRGPQVILETPGVFALASQAVG
ncbi:GNAT family N-acetyltransferase [Salinisphaera hydrothermalis]|uniref:GNAT family N-acetyltransferase n=1 Tax=Salinisphaera hydrothermalis TaxID=563188 RepID=UPI00333F1424